MNHQYERQRGMSLTQTLLGGCVTAVFLLLGMKLIPVYYENHTVKQVLSQLGASNVTESVVRNTNKFVLRDRLQRQLNLKSVHYVKPSHIQIEKIDDGYQVMIAYDAKVKILANLSAFMSFTDSVVVRG